MINGQNPCVHPPASWFHRYNELQGLDHTECRPLLRLEPGSRAAKKWCFHHVSPMKNVVSLGRKNGAFYSIENGGLHRWNQPIVASTIEGLQCTSLATKTLPASMRRSRKVSERTLKKLPNARAYFPIPLEIHEPEHVRPLRLCPRKRQHIPSIHGWTINFFSSSYVSPFFI